MMPRRGGWLAAWTFLLAMQSGIAANVSRETFDGSLNGWTTTIGATSSSWQYDAGTARAVFSFQPFPVNETIELRGESGAAGGDFSGNYPAAGIDIIGFDFLAESVRPSDVILEVERDGTNVIHVPFNTNSLAALTTGVWYRLTQPISLDDRDAWTDLDNAYSTILSNVTRVSILVGRNATTAPHAFRVDNIFIAPLPHADLIATGPAGVNQQWSQLQSGTLYRVERYVSASATWSQIGVLTATGTTEAISVGAGAGDGWYRFRFESPQILP